MRLSANPVCISTSVNKKKKGEYYLWEHSSGNLGAPYERNHDIGRVVYGFYATGTEFYYIPMSIQVWHRLCANAICASSSRNRIE